MLFIEHLVCMRHHTKVSFKMHPSLEYCEIDIVIPVGQRVEVMSQITHLADATEHYRAGAPCHMVCQPHSMALTLLVHASLDV